MIHLFVSDVSPMPNRLDGAANAQRARHAQELRSELDSHSHCALIVLLLHILEVTSEHFAVSMLNFV